MQSLTLVSQLQKLRKSQEKLHSWDLRKSLFEKLLLRWPQLHWEPPAQFSSDLWKDWVVAPVPEAWKQWHLISPNPSTFPLGLMLVVLRGPFSLRKLGEIMAMNLLSGNPSLFLVSESQQSWLPAWEQICSEGLEDFFSCQIASMQDSRELARHPSVQGVLVWGTESEMDVELWTERPHRHQLIINDSVVSALSWEPPVDGVAKALWQLIFSLEGKNPYAPHRFLVLEKDMSNWLELLSAHLAQIESRPWSEKEAFKQKILQEQGHVVAETSGALLVRDLPQCSEMHQTPLRHPVLFVNSVKYRHEFAKWINNSPSADAVWIWGDVEVANKVGPQLQVGHLWLNQFDLKGGLLPWGVNHSVLGNPDRQCFGSFFSRRQLIVSSPNGSALSP